jgi:hypothetical protein
MPLRSRYLAHSPHPHPHHPYCIAYTGLLTKKAAHVFFEIAATARVRIRLVCQSESKIISLSQNSVADDILVRQIEGERKRGLFMSNFSAESLCSADYIGRNTCTFDSDGFDTDRRRASHYGDNDNEYNKIDINGSRLKEEKPSRLNSARDAIADFFLPIYSSESEMTSVLPQQYQGHSHSHPHSQNTVVNETVNILHVPQGDPIESKV